MNVPKFTLGNTLTLLALLGSFTVFLMRYSERISNIEKVNEEKQHRIERIEGLVRDMYPKLEKVNNNVEWLVQQERRKSP
jgi:hypothetical protein